MLRVFENSELNLNMTVIKDKEQIYFKAKDVARALGYANTKAAVINHVSEEHKKRLSDLGGSPWKTTFNGQPNAVFVTEPGFYELIFGSEMPNAKLFQKWVFEDVLPQIRKTGSYTGGSNNKLMFKIEDEYDLHCKVVQYIRRFYPQLLLIAGLGELQDTPAKRIKSWKKGYQKGQPDLIIGNCHKRYRGFCLEFKTPKGNGVTSEAQKELLRRYELNGFKTLVSEDYDVIIRALIDYCQGLRVPCPYCTKKFKSEETLAAHLKVIHRIAF